MQGLIRILTHSYVYQEAGEKASGEVGPTSKK